MSQRPAISSFLALVSDGSIHIRCVIHKTHHIIDQEDSIITENIIPSVPWEHFDLLKRTKFRIRIIGFSEQNIELFNREFDSESYGVFNIKIPSQYKKSKISKIQIYETKYHPGLELMLGSFIPHQINSPKKIIITDFDRTLVDTKFSTAREMVHSLRNPLSRFPTVPKSLELFKDYIAQGFHPFVLSASPHFYEKAVRDWLYQNQIFTANIFLKDYKKVFSFLEGELTPKDLKKQGFYKLQSLVQILQMVNLPDELILMGDCFEADMLIYLSLRSVLVEKIDPWIVWKSIKRLEDFDLNIQQQITFLTGFNQLASLVKYKKIDIKIYIRRPDQMQTIVDQKNLHVQFLEKQKSSLIFYQ